MNTDAVTLLISQGGNPVNKEFVLGEDGKVTKRMVQNNGHFLAKTVPVPDLEAMASVLHELGENPSATLSLGLFKKAPDCKFIIEPRKRLARRLGVDPEARDKWAGFHEIDGKWYVARAKVNMTFSSWLLLDRDTVRDMPRELVDLDRDQWLAAMAKLLPRLDKARHIIVPSSSSRVCLNGVPRESSSWHAFVQVSNPDDLPRVWPQVLAKSFSTTLEPDPPPWEDDPVTLGFLRPKFSRKAETEGEVVASQPWSIYDPSTCSPERLVFDGQPVVKGEGLTLTPPQILVHEGDRLDLSAFEDITPEDAREMEKRARVTVEIRREGKGEKIRVANVQVISKTLTLDLEIETAEGLITVGELHKQGAGHTRCQSPFRESESWAAYYGTHQDGSPFIFDSGTCTKYVLPEAKSYGDALYDLSHDGLALHMGRRWQPDARYVDPWKGWLFYDEARWRRDEIRLYMTRTRDYLRERADSLVKAAIDGEIENLSVEQAEAIAKILRSVGMVKSVSELATSNKELVATVDQWDQVPYLLGTPDGYVDLRTGKLQAPAPDLYITKLTAVAPAPAGTAAPIWTAFLDRIFCHDPDLIPFVQRALGLSLIGEIIEHVLFFCWGQGGNGKGVLLNSVSKILADYAAIAPADMFMSSQSDRHPCDMAMLRGARFVTAQEIAQGKAWDEPKLKSLTGGDPITARFMKENFFTYQPQFTLFVAGNHKPSFRSTDEAIRRRVLLIPFLQVIPASERDVELPTKLETEWPAILRWMIEGCQAYLRDGLNPPASAVAATKDYLDSEDILGQWLSERCIIDPSAGWTALSLLFQDWQVWAGQRGHPVGSDKSLSTRLDERGLHRRKKTYGQGFEGIQLKPRMPEEVAAAAAGHDANDDDDDGSIWPDVRARARATAQQGTPSSQYDFNGTDRHDRLNRHRGSTNGHVLTCAHCQKPILEDSDSAAVSSGETLHYACVTEWLAANP